MERRGQTSFELIFVLSVILMLSIFVINGFNSIKNPTAAMAIAKGNTLKALNVSGTDFIINKISFDSGSNTLKITTIPDSGIICKDINAAGTRDLIRENSLFDSFSITLNGNPC